MNINNNEFEPNYLGSSDKRNCFFDSENSDPESLGGDNDIVVKNSKEFKTGPVKVVQNEDMVNLKNITENIDSKKVFLNKVL